MKNDPLPVRLARIIDRHAVPLAPGRRETHVNLASLAKRIGLADTEQVEALIASGAIKSIGPLHKNQPNGTQRYESDELDAARRDVFVTIAEHVVEAWPDDADPDLLPVAVNHAIDAYKKGLADGTAPKGFAHRIPGRAVVFATREEEARPGLLRGVATGAALAGAAYGGLSYLRGSKAGASGVWGKLKAGNAANVADIRKIGGYIRPRNFSATLTPANARARLLRFGREPRRNGA